MLKHKKILTASLAAIILGCLLRFDSLEFFVIHKALAQAASANPNDFYNTAITAIGFIQQILLWVLFRILLMLEMLFNPNTFITDFLDPTDPTAVRPLHDLWKISRDIVNIILAFLLVAGAVTTIVTAKGEIFSSYIRKFLIAIILVNFSWWFPRVILDTANVLTATVYSLPAAIGFNCVDDEGGDNCYIWEDPQFDLDKTKVEALGNDYEVAYDILWFKRTPLSASANTPPAILLGLVINNARIFKIAKIPNIPGVAEPDNIPLSTERAAKQVRIVIYAAFSLIIIAALAFPLIAMLVVFVVRIPIIWLTVAMMPFMFVGLIMGEKMKDFNTMNLIWKKFLGAAFVPLFAAVPLSLGFLLLNSGMHIIAMPEYEKTISSGVFGVETFLSLLWLAMTLGVLWVGTFTALKAAKIAESIVQSIQNYGQMVGKGVAKLPLRIPFIPAPGGAPGGFMSAGAAYAKVKGSLNHNAAINEELNKLYPGSSTGTGGALADRVLTETKYTTNKTHINNHIAPHFTSVNNFNGKNVAAHAAANPGELAKAKRNIEEIVAEMKKVDSSTVIDEKTISQFANRFGANYQEAVVKQLRTL
ncbi:MAG: hypothetical protein K9M03_01585 [Kiritimatiellales bacterium]|nr:hypothetical protein [Kiritimatiellales bacterium]